MTALHYQLILYTLASAIGLAVLLWAATTENLPDGEGF